MFLVALAAPGGPPPIPEKGESGISLVVVEDLIESMVCLAAHVMVEGVVYEEECASVERHVKLFLSSYESFDGPRRLKIAARPAVRGRRKT